MPTRELFKRRVIELIHGLNYEDCWLGEWGREKNSGNANVWKPTITIGRVMKAISNCKSLIGCEWRGQDVIIKVSQYFSTPHWKLTNSDGSECTDDDQTDETIEKLYELIK